MSDEMAVSDNATGEAAPVQSDEATVAFVGDANEAPFERPNEVPAEQSEEPQPEEEDPPKHEISVLHIIKKEPDYNQPEEDLLLESEIKEEFVEPQLETTVIKEEIEEPIGEEYSEIDNDNRGIKRRASIAFSDADDEVEFLGFPETKYNNVAEEYSEILKRLEAEVTEVSKTLTPVQCVMATPHTPIRASKRPRKDTDGSRPSSALSSKSDDNTTATPGRRGRRKTTTTEISSPLLRIPLEKGWKRELVYRAALDVHSRRNADIYYYSPVGKKLRSNREISEQLHGTGLTLENFSFFKEPLGVDDPEREIIRDAKVIRRMESPIATPAPPVEGKRAHKPKAPKGVSPEPVKSPPVKLKVKSVGSRLRSKSPATPVVKQEKQKKGSSTPAPSAAAQGSAAASAPDNNNTAAWKKPSELKTRSRVSNGATTSPAAMPAPAPAVSAVSPRRRGRPRAACTDYFSAFCKRANKENNNLVVQIFQYLGMRDLAHCARVSKLWKQLVATPALWRHVRMKNSQVSDWGGLCAALKRHGTKWLDLRKMLLPHNDAVFWEQFAQHIGTVETLERLEMCRCPARAVEAAAGALRGLVALSALAIRDAALDPTPLGRALRLRELRLKSMAGLALSADLTHLASLTHLMHLSLTSIKELGWRACDVIGELKNLESLELGECTFRAEFAQVLARLSKLKRLRLERGTAHCAAPAILRALALLPCLTRLELVNIDVKIGFDDALAECKNIQRLLIIPTYVSQSATTNKQVLSGVLRLKETLTHLMWGVTIELLRVTELFIDQCSAGGARRHLGECIPMLKPVPGCRLPMDHQLVAGPPQVEILPLPTLQRLLSTQLPNTKLKLLRIPFHATWRQTLADFQ